MSKALTSGMNTDEPSPTNKTNAFYLSPEVQFKEV